MYIYARYREHCLPTLVDKGATQKKNNMLALFLQWNIKDPVSYLEMQRNDYKEKVCVSRNLFIDNPYLATLLWGGEPAEDTWGLYRASIYQWEESITIYLDSTTETIWIDSSSKEVNFTYTLSDFNGKEIISKKSKIERKEAIGLSNGVYILNIKEGNHL